MLTRIERTWSWLTESYVVFVALGLLVGLAIAPAATQVTGGADGTVAVVHVDGTIDGAQAAQYAAMMEQARNEADAVVVVGNSGGGSAAGSEGMYMQTKRTAEEMPVIASVEAGALSGAYYTILPSDEIYVKPSSSVGSVGVVAAVPQAVEPNDFFGTTGPHKLTGTTERQFFHDLATLQNAFVGTVFLHRGDELELSEPEVASASIHVGAEAVDNGYADEVGTQQDAIAAAAAAAGLERPEVNVLRPDDADATFMLESTYLASDAENKEYEPPKTLIPDGDRTGVPNFLMVPAEAFAGGDGPDLLTGAEAEVFDEAIQNNETVDEEDFDGVADTGTNWDGGDDEDGPDDENGTDDGEADATADGVDPHDGVELLAGVS